MTTLETDLEIGASGEARWRPRLARGVELLGPYEHSGYREPPLMVRRADNQLVHMPPLLYLVLQRLDGRRNVQEIAGSISDEVGRELTPEDAAYLVEEKLVPLGVAVGPGDEEPELHKADQLLALRLRTRVIPERVVAVLARLFAPFFWPPVLVVGVGAFVAFDVWLFFVHGVAGGAHEALNRPGLLLLALGVMIVAAVFHEIGHAAACRYGGARPGVMGVGLYLVWPAFYTDVTDAYRLGRGGRLRTDLGGVYFNALFILALGGLYAATGLESLLLGALLIHFEMAHQMLPFLRLDGYYVVADLVGVPDLFQRIRPILWSFVPRRPLDPRVAELKPWVRYVVTGWVAVVVPIILLQLILVVIVAPRLFGTALSSLATQWTGIVEAFSAGRWLGGLAGIVQSIVLILPLAGITYLFAMLAIRFVRGWRETKGRPVARSMLSVTGAAVLTVLGLVWWPEPGRYEPLRSDEQWVLPLWHGGSGGTTRPGVGGVDPAGTLTPSEDAQPTASAGPSPSPSPSPETSPSPTATSTSPDPTGSPSVRSPSPSGTWSPSPTPSPSPSPSSPSVAP